MRIDSHQHFWKYHPQKQDWISDDMAVLKQDFLPAHLKPLLHQQQLDGCITVQCEQHTDEINFMLQLAKENSFIKGIVPWIDLCAENLEEQLAYYAQFNLIKGFRHVVQAEPDKNFLLRQDFCKGISFLKQFGFTYDILIYHYQLNAAIEFVSLFPEQPFVIDHIAKPDIKSRDIHNWASQIKKIAANPHVFCKVSGMVTEADVANWKKEDLLPYLDIVFQSFGTHRIMFGSDWPVCLLAAKYHEVYQIVADYISALSRDEQDAVLGKNAAAFYHL